MPIRVRITAITANIKIVTIAITNAFSHPQSKKCLTKANHTNRTISVAIIPEKKYSKNPPIKVPKTTIQMASVNFAFFPPANSLPDIQRTGAKMIIRITIEMTKTSKLIAILPSPDITLLEDPFKIFVI
jgi:hypothetical protein